MRSAGDPPSTFAHCPQKRLSGGLEAPHFGQTAASGVAHSPQKREPTGLSWWHREHFIGPDLNPESLVAPRGPGQERELPRPCHGSRTERPRTRAIARAVTALP